jgi:hypothetical protein
MQIGPRLETPIFNFFQGKGVVRELVLLKQGLRRCYDPAFDPREYAVRFLL